jgi:hypothetical protein
MRWGAIESAIDLGEAAADGSPLLSCRSVVVGTIAVRRNERWRTGAGEEFVVFVSLDTRRPRGVGVCPQFLLLLLVQLASEWRRLSSRA